MKAEDGGRFCGWLGCFRYHFSDDIPTESGRGGGGVEATITATRNNCSIDVGTPPWPLCSLYALHLAGPTSFAARRSTPALVPRLDLKTAAQRAPRRAEETLTDTRSLTFLRLEKLLDSPLPLLTSRRSRTAVLTPPRRLRRSQEWEDSDALFFFLVASRLLQPLRAEPNSRLSFVDTLCSRH